MKKEINYYVIGRLYEYYCYGGTKTLLGAKRLATKNIEYWDNWGSWHKPMIYKAENTIETESKGRIVTFEGQRIRIPLQYPLIVWDSKKRKWIEYGE